MRAAGPILQVGFGAFGATHIRAWQALGAAGRVIVADPDADARARAASLAPETSQVANYCDVLADCALVDILTPTDTHHEIAAAAIAAGKPVFIEKPVVVSAEQGRDLAARARAAAVPVMAGYYFRFHPKATALRGLIAAQELGNLRLLTGRFAGFKRTRRDSGALHNDAVHFLDLFCCLVGRPADRAHAVARDHFDRGMDDMVLATLEWDDGPVAHVEAGYIQPGRWPDAVVPGAITSKEIAVSGAKGAVEIDFAAETWAHHRVGHEGQNGVWFPRHRVRAEAKDVAAADAVAVLTAELGAFLRRADGRENPGGGFADDGLDGGLNMALLLAALETSAREHRVVTLER